ncbi:hypothetical protein [Microbacterium thalli]|uniref:Uncharacterized protein n=1 Tax=Microbacterium thalli TaxID=3027921 RepID=A0ABT5SER3_9MICO|nr:hypothetical protein [Microbacterium thalli]MDD7928720.1 hypothetical protein [Microbacterium thalli]MDD7961303.1 hypothetical protein [Microbacterium thalli]MDN8547842.1 hypothetical protein [Microbacterium thalli]
MSSHDTPTGDAGDTAIPSDEPTGDRHDDDTSAEQSITDDAPTGGDPTTEDQLTADNAAEEDMLKTLDPGDPPA